MTSQEYIESRVVPEFQDKATVLGLITHNEKENWWPIHRNEEIPQHVQIKISESWE